MNLKVAQVIGLNTDQKAAQVISLIQSGENAFFAVLELASDDAFTKGRQVLSQLSDFYFEFEGTPSEKLNATFEEASQKMIQDQFDLLIASISGKVLYIIGKGEVEVYLKREDKLSSIFTHDTPSQLVSGFLNPNDILFLSTKNLRDFLADDLPKVLNLPSEVLEEEVADRLNQANIEGNGLAGLQVRIEEDKEIAVEEIVEGEQSLEKDERRKITLEFLKKIPRILGKITRILPKSGRGRLILAIILLVVIVGGIGLKFKSIKDQQKRESVNQLIQQAKEDFEAAKALVTLNPTEAKIKLDSAKTNTEQALVLESGNKEAKDLKEQIEKDSGSILRQSAVSDFPLFLDLNLIKENFKATQMSLSTGKILLLDPENKTLILIDIGKKSNQILGGSQTLGEAVFASFNGGLTFVHSKDKGILRVDSTNQKVSEVAKIDDEWGNIADLYAFAGNIYILDEIKNQIWKYLPTSDGYSGKRVYLTASTKADFAGGLRMQIESSIYVLKKGGEMLRFTKGDKDHFGYEGLDRGVKDPKSFFVSSETEDLYLLDSGNSRLLILTKTGTYKAQMQGDKFAQATDLVVDEVGKKVYLLEGSKIFQVDLK